MRSRRINHSLRSNGFSLIEVLVSLVILSISLLALAGLMNITTYNNSFGGHLTEASTFAQDKLEELRVTGWEDINSGNDPNPILGATGFLFNRIWTVTPGPNSPAPPHDNEKIVTVTIQWNDRAEHSVSFSASMTR